MTAAEPRPRTLALDADVAVLRLVMPEMAPAQVESILGQLERWRAGEGGSQMEVVGEIEAIGGTYLGSGGLGSRSGGQGVGELGTRSMTSRERDIARGLIEPTEAEREVIEAREAARWNMAAIGDPVVTGGPDAHAVFEAIAEHHPRLRYCYQKEQNRTPSLIGDVVVSLQVAEDGTVRSAGAEPMLAGGEVLDECVQARFMRMTLPESSGAYTVEVPLSFRPPSVPQ